MIKLVFKDGSELEVNLMQKLCGIQRKGYRPVDITVDNKIRVDSEKIDRWVNSILIGCINPHVDWEELFTRIAYYDM